MCATGCDGGSNDVCNRTFEGSGRRGPVRLVLFPLRLLVFGGTTVDRRVILNFCGCGRSHGES